MEADDAPESCLVCARASPGHGLGHSVSWYGLGSRGSAREVLRSHEEMPSRCGAAQFVRKGAALPCCSVHLGLDWELRTSRVVRRGRLRETLAGASPNDARKGGEKRRGRGEEKERGRKGEEKRKRKKKRKRESVWVYLGFKTRIYPFRIFEAKFRFYAN